jgi:Phage integrase family
MQVAVTRSCVRNHFGKTKTDASGQPVLLHASICALLMDWRPKTHYSGEGDFIFPSERLNGTKPLTPDMALKKVIRPSLVRAGVTGKVVGWFRHSLATNLRSLGVDVKMAQELLRHANSRNHIDLYTQAVSADTRMANGRQVEVLLGQTTEGISESSLVIPRMKPGSNPGSQTIDSYWFMAGTTGFEPATSAETGHHLTVTYRN